MPQPQWHQLLDEAEPKVELLYDPTLDDYRIPSKFNHRYYTIENWLSEDYDSDENLKIAPVEKAHLVSSEVHVPGKRAQHSVVLDIDIPATLVPSTTAGHHHLYIDAAMSWRDYKNLLKALSRAGVIEPGFANASIRRKHSSVRVPWLKKQK
jgi:hypothetical protein